MAANRYGVWLFRSANPLSDGRLWRVDENGDSLPTSFSRALGVRTSERRLCFSGLFGELVRPRTSLTVLIRGLFGSSTGSIKPLLPSDDLANRLRIATGFAVVTAPGLKFRTVRGLADLVAIVHVRAEDESIAP